MFEKSEMLYLYLESALHAGSGGSIGLVDLPIQRERITQFPVVQASGIKGKLRAHAYQWDKFLQLKEMHVPKRLRELKEESAWREKDEAEQQAEASRRARKSAAKELGIEAVFGPESDEADHHAGAISPGDARLLLFPVRSLMEVFAWTTCRTVLARFKRDVEAAGKGQTIDWSLENLPDNSGAWIVDDSNLAAKNGNVILEEFSFPATAHEDVKGIAKWLSQHAVPQSGEYDFFRKKMETDLVILPETDFRDFTKFATEVVTRIRIDQESKTVAPGALWTEELLPSDTVLYAPLHASRPRTTNGPKGWTHDDVLQLVRDLNIDRIQLGGDETVGRGIVKLHFQESSANGNGGN